MLRCATRSKTSVSWSRRVSTASLLNTMPPLVDDVDGGEQVLGGAALVDHPGGAGGEAEHDLREVPGAVQHDRRLARVLGEQVADERRRALPVDQLVDEHQAVGMSGGEVERLLTVGAMPRTS